MLSKAFNKLLNRTPLLTLGTSLGLNLILWLLALFLFSQNNPATILHYSIDVGIDLIGEGSQIIVLPAIGLFVLLGNSLLFIILKRNYLKTAWIILSGIPVTQLVLLSSILLIWQANQ